MPAKFLLLAALLLPLSATAQPTLVSPGVLTYGTAATYPPFQSMEAGRIVGHSIDLGEALAQRMGLRAEPVNFEFTGLIPALQAARFDIINSALRATPQRAEQVELIPYMRIGTNIVVRAGNPRGINGRADVCGRTVAVDIGTTVEAFAREDHEACVKAGRAAVTVQVYPGRQAAALALRQGRADAYYDTTPAAVLAMTAAPDAFAIAGETFGFTENALAIRKGDATMRAAVEAALATMVTDGSYDALLRKYNFPPTVSVFGR